MSPVVPVVTVRRSFPSDAGRALCAWLEDSIGGFGALARHDVASLTSSASRIVRTLAGRQGAIDVDVSLDGGAVEVRLSGRQGSHLLLFRSASI
jgi:hypothetical protein